jgi:Transposase DDE domain
MSALSIVSHWRHCVADLLTELHGHQTHTLADLSFAVASAGNCQAGSVAPYVPTHASVASSRRRFERFLANARLRDRPTQRLLASSLLRHWTGCTVLLLLDETPKANDLRAMCVRVAYLKRALPLAWVCYTPDAPPQRLPELIRSLLRQVRSCLPGGCEVILLADRGLAWPLLVDFCQESGWHYVLRLQSTTRVRFPDGSERAVRQLAPRKGSRWLGEGKVFKKAGWRGANVVATWERDRKEPWLLVTDRRASLRHCRVYGKRMWVEESFRDDKSSGFGWGQSQVNDPEHAKRLLVLLALAMVLAASVGTETIKAGRRRGLDPHVVRRLSVIQLGLRRLREALTHATPQRLKLDRLYLYPK